ncbi:hypothetical protein H9660_14285 [Clostridium sp. Sa3CUN1]|uniref:Lipoprotein n=1 Tax=Clostridium gallinarum TaxID=2762246 RepID=A0ABR8Q7A4_9CLOT|nr:hypothetical protein [Clostridium gallinarum]MBD7916312.1 hypothetical protein [Clostridium gallinarum]
MKKVVLIFIFIISFQFLIVGCSSNSNEKNMSEEDKIKETIDLVLSYENGYDEVMKKHISEKNFYVCNYIEFYSLYIGELKLEKYESNIISIRNNDDRYIVCMSINMEGKAIETHGDEEESDEVIGEDVPVEVILNKRNGELYIEKFTEYENLEKAKELNEGFK